ncbi:MAG: hypothetical protein IIZ94_04630 [Prevotella sp.]|nr:hypothetical protein [Prevotella sp.]
MTEEKIVKNKGWNNLIPYKKGDTKGKSEAGKLGGKASGESKRRMKTFREELKELLEVEVENGKGEKVTVQKNINSALILKAAKGDVKAYEVIRDTLGQKPVEEKSVVVNAPMESRIEVIEAMRKRFYVDGNKKDDK